MLGDVDRLATRQAGFHLFGDDSASRKSADELQARLAALIAILVAKNGVADVSKSSGDEASAVNIRQ